jgi:prepilin-type N-terminal cleavage/methylation domain-containing protein
MRTSVSRGFTVLEMTFSIAIIAIILVMLGALIQTLPLIALTKNQDLALKIARNEIESLRALGYDSLPSSGSFSNTLLSSLPSGAGTRTITAYNADTKEVLVTVSWVAEQGGTNHSVSLTTLITDIGGL